MLKTSSRSERSGSPQARPIQPRMGDTFTIYRCRVCKAHDWAAEEVVHVRHEYPGSINRLALVRRPFPKGFQPALGGG